MGFRRFLIALLPALAFSLTQPAVADGPPDIKARAGTLQDVGALIKALPDAQSRPAIAAEVSAEGHWTFLNTAGERFTTASPDELKRVLPTIAPDAAKPVNRLALVLTEDTVFKQRQHLQALPLASDRRTDLMIAVDQEAYPLLRRGERAAERYYAAIRPNLLVEMTERRLFDEAVWQLAHPLKRASIRILALEPGGPASLPSSPRLDPQTKRALTDNVDPKSLATALRSLSGQTAILTARRDGETLAIRPSSGPEITLPYAPIAAAAESADVNLVLLQSATPRQPGTRSWMWQRVSVGRLDDALGRDHLADFLNAIATPQSRLLVSATDGGSGRIQIRALPLKDDSSPRTGIGEALSDLVSNVAGQVVVSGVEANLRGRDRQHELDRRLIPWVPSFVQYGYLVLLLLGLAGHAVARDWWAKIWPPELREGYGNAFGHALAKGIRATVYIALFAPLAAVASGPMALLRLFAARRLGQASVRSIAPR